MIKLINWLQRLKGLLNSLLLVSVGTLVRMEYVGESGSSPIASYIQSKRSVISKIRRVTEYPQFELDGVVYLVVCWWYMSIMNSSSSSA